jgi:hypothetical protein
MKQISGILKSGHRVASGMADNSPYEKGTLEMQLPFFKALGLDISKFYLGTLNIDIAPHTFEVVKPQYTFCNVKWHRDYPTEDFSFALCELIFRDVTYEGLVYYPHPETKIGHFQDPSIIEAIAPPLPNIHYGDQIAIALNPSEIKIL